MGSTTPGDGIRPHWRVTTEGLRVWTYQVAKDHGVWSRLPCTPPELEEAPGWSRSAVDAWLTSSDALNLVRWSDDGYVHPEPPKPGPSNGNGSERTWARLEEVLARPTRPHGSTWPWPTSGDPRLHEAFHRTLPDRDADVARMLEATPRVLEVGAGDGAWVCTVAEEVPAARITAHEHQEPVLRSLGDRLQTEGIDDEVTLRSTRAESMSYSGGFDLAHLGQVLPQVPSIVTVLGRANHALERGGVLVVSGFLRDDAAGEDDPGNRSVRASRFLRYSRGEASLSKQRLWRLLVEAGFQRIRFHPAGVPGAWFGIAIA